MATPTSNSVTTSHVSPASAGLGRYTTSGFKWGGGMGQGVTLTFSFPGASPSHPADYGYYIGNDEWLGYQALTAAEKAACRAGLAVWSAVANITFREVADNASTVGEIRFVKSTNLEASEAAHAYYPANDPSAGDVWINANYFNQAPGSLNPGTFDFSTIVHELGHALGLKHSFEAPNAIPTQLDNLFYSVMSYSARVSGDSGWSSFQPTTAMYYDLLGIQALYGRNMSHNAGNTTHTYVQGRTYFETIDDAGGIDTILYQGAQAVIIDLTPGRFSSLGNAISFDNGSTRATVGIGPNSIIENAIGGSGADTITGNSAANGLSGLDGADRITGLGGNDTLQGGHGNDALLGSEGNDRLFGGFGNDTLTGGTGADCFHFNTALSAATNRDRIADFNAADDAIYLARAVFGKLALGTLAAGNFVTGAAARDGNDFIIYDKATGVLSYDSNGSAAGGAIVITALAANLALTAADIVVF